MEEPLAARVSPIKAVLESVVNDFANASFTAGGEETSESRASVGENATIELWLELCCAHAKLQSAPFRPSYVMDSCKIWRVWWRDLPRINKHM